MEEKKNLIKRIIAIIMISIIASVIILACINRINIEYVKQTSSINTSHENSKIADDEIIEFAKNEILEVLVYPETAIFSKEQINKIENNWLVDIYCKTKNQKNEEMRVEFACLIENQNNKLNLLGITTNEDTCTKDVKEAVKELIMQMEYKSIFDEYFSSINKITIDYNKFINYLDEYSINLQKATFTEKEFDENGKIELYIEEEGKRGIWYFTFRNGLIYDFDIILKNDW